LTKIKDSQTCQSVAPACAFRFLRQPSRPKPHGGEEWAGQYVIVHGDQVP
jgi:hypothetical protein